MNFEKIVVKGFTKQSYTDPKTGSINEWYRCEGRTSHDETFSFSLPITEELKIGDTYYMYLDKDRYFRAVVRYRKA